MHGTLAIATWLRIVVARWLRFLDWAARYDEGGREIRSRALHDAWLARLPCPVLKLEADRPSMELLSDVEAGFDPRR